MPLFSALAKSSELNIFNIWNDNILPFRPETSEAIFCLSRGPYTGYRTGALRYCLRT